MLKSSFKHCQVTLVTRGKGFESNIWKQISHNIPATFEAKQSEQMAEEKNVISEKVAIFQSWKTRTFNSYQLGTSAQTENEQH